MASKRSKNSTSGCRPWLTNVCCVNSLLPTLPHRLRPVPMVQKHPFLFVYQCPKHHSVCIQENLVFTLVPEVFFLLSAQTQLSSEAATTRSRGFLPARLQTNLMLRWQTIFDRFPDIGKFVLLMNKKLISFSKFHVFISFACFSFSFWYIFGRFWWCSVVLGKSRNPRWLLCLKSCPIPASYDVIATLLGRTTTLDVLSILQVSLSLS